jgi:hypothetical protein
MTVAREKEESEMKALAVAVGQVFGLVLGNGFTAPVDETLEKYAHLRLFG